MTDKKVDVPCSAADLPNAKDQSISSANQKGNVISAQPVVDGSAESKPGYWVGDSYTIKRIEQE